MRVTDETSYSVHIQDRKHRFRRLGRDGRAPQGGSQGPRACPQSRKGEYISDLFQKRYGPDVFEIAHAEDFASLASQPWMLEALMNGCAGVVHMATDTSFGMSPEQVIARTVELARAVLEAAAKTPTVRRVVFTSSAATLPRLQEPVHITPSSWASDDVVRMAWSSSSLVPPPDQDAFARSLIVYAASKVEAERACWAFMQQRSDSGKEGGGKGGRRAAQPQPQ
ncbi:aldehyde reductase [Apiospora phragmitis]|uniref:Aldehyde reductase n=1 Tax=Apiospora phragmitis TaxID=2905665 RepID=A0ABR1VQR7_9PEZI